MNTQMKTIKSDYVRFRITKRERQIIDLIKEIDSTSVSEHVRRALNYYARNAHNNIFQNPKEVYNES